MRFKNICLSGVMLSAGALIAIAAGCGSESSPTVATPPTMPTSTNNAPVTSTIAAAHR
jgi:hypothetical protein